MGSLTPFGKNTVLDFGLPGTLYAALHSGDPGTDGAANELSGGDPAYARVAVTMAAAADGGRATTGQVALNTPAGSTVRYASLWTAVTGGNCVATDDVTQESYTGQGQYLLKSFPVALG